MFGSRWSRAACPIGIDVGSRAVRLLQLERTSEGGLRAIAAASHELPSQVQGVGGAFHDAVAEAIARMIPSVGFIGRRCVSCLPSPAVHYKNLRLPRMPADELPNAVQWEAAERLHLGRDAAAIQFLDAGEVRQGEELRQEVILLAASNELVEAHTEALVSCGLEPIAIDAVPSALARCSAASDPAAAVAAGNEAAARVVIDVGYASSKVLIVRDERIVFFKVISVGGRTFDDAVATAMHIPASEAAAARQAAREGAAYGGRDAGELRDEVAAAVRPAMADLAREVGLCLRYYSVTFRGRRPSWASLVGGEAHEPALSAVLNDGAGIVAEPVDPLSAVATDPVRRVIPSPIHAARWAVAAGLSLRPEPRLAQRVLLRSRPVGAVA